MGRRTNTPMATSGSPSNRPAHQEPGTRQEPAAAQRGPSRTKSWHSAEMAREFHTWLTEILVRANYAARRVDGTPTYWLKDLERDGGIPRQTMIDIVNHKRRPLPDSAVAIARALGIHPLAMLYRAGYLSVEQLHDLIGTGRLPSPDELRAGLAALEQLPAGIMPHGVIEQQRRLLMQMLEWLEARTREFALTPEEFGPLAAEKIKAEIVASPSPIVPAADPLGAIGSDPPTASAPTRPGPTRVRTPDGSPPDAEESEQAAEGGQGGRGDAR